MKKPARRSGMSSGIGSPSPQAKSRTNRTVYPPHSNHPSTCCVLETAIQSMEISVPIAGAAQPVTHPSKSATAFREHRKSDVVHRLLERTDARDFLQQFFERHRVEHLVGRVGQFLVDQAHRDLAGRELAGRDGLLDG